VILVVIGIFALIAWSGLFLGTVLAVLAAVVPSTMEGKQQNGF
jgi:hypothetical protein